MAARLRVGVTGNHRRWAPGWWCSWIALRLAGARAERISLRHRPADAAFDAIIIGGGNDIGAEHYGGDINDKVRTDPERDLLEITWIETALERDIPLLGICRGAQLINVLRGGDLHQDIRGLRHRTYNRPGLMATKRVYLEPDSQLARICRRRKLRVNSLHHQAIREPGDGLRVVGRDRDDFVQAVEGFPDCRVIGVQWHPEYLFYLPSHFSLFRWLLSKARA